MMMNSLTQQLYRYTQDADDIFSVVLADETHPVFKAHFESYPLLPAFLQLDIAAEILNCNVKGILRSKFMEPLFPNDTLTLQREEKSGKSKIRWIKNGKIASEITFE